MSEFEPGNTFQLNNQDFKLEQTSGELVVAREIPRPASLDILDIFVLIIPEEAGSAQEQTPAQSDDPGSTEPIPFRPRPGIPNFSNGLE